MNQRSSDPGVRGERTVPSVARPLSIQSRISNVLTLVLMLTIGVAFLVWYYLHVAARTPRAGAAHAAISGQVHAEAPLPSLGKLQLLSFAETSSPTQPPDILPRVDPAQVPLPEAHLNSAPPTEPPTASALERRLSGVAFALAGSPVTSNRGSSSGTDSYAVPMANSAVASPTAATTGTLAALLSAQRAPTAVAQLLPTQRLLLPKGAFIDCTLETAIDSTLPGLTTCVTATDTFSADGTVVLLERGTKLIGETRGQVQQASSRVFVLWTEARTPTGVVVPLDSPGADELGRSGLPGEVDRHFWQRFGAAILISTIDGAVQAAVQSNSKGGGTVIYNPSGPQDVLSEVLKNTLNTAPTVIKHNGDRIQVLVARDVDFGSVYELRHAVARP
jgi:type IV secretion system protein VirB10